MWLSAKVCFMDGLCLEHGTSMQFTKQQEQLGIRAITAATNMVHFRTAMHILYLVQKYLSKKQHKRKKVTA